MNCDPGFNNLALLACIKYTYRTVSHALTYTYFDPTRPHVTRAVTDPSRTRAIWAPQRCDHDKEGATNPRLPYLTLPYVSLKQGVSVGVEGRHTRQTV